MTSSPDHTDPANLEAHVRAITDAAARATELLRALAPLRAHWEALDEAVAAMARIGTPAVDTDTPDGRPAEPREELVIPSNVTAIPDTGLRNRRDAIPDPYAELAAVAAQPEPVQPRREDVPDTVADEEPAAEVPRTTNGIREVSGRAGSRTFTVTVTRDDAPLDLVRVHTALDRIDGVTSLALVSYTRGRAVLQLDTDRPIDDVPLVEGLRAAFPEGVTTERQSADDIVVAIGAI